MHARLLVVLESESATCRPSPVARFAHQLGAPYVQIWPSHWLDTPDEPACWAVEVLEAAKRRCDERGLVLEVIASHNYIRAIR